MRMVPFFEKQERLDNKIVEVHNLQGINLTGDVTQALYTELGELSNEIGFFKYWKINKKNDKERQYDEWADVLHFLLSLGNKYGHSEIINRIYPTIELQRRLSKLQDELIKEEPVFHQLFGSIYHCDLSMLEDYLYALEALLLIGYLIGMDEKDMQEAYDTKNAVNYSRLENSY